MTIVTAVENIGTAEEAFKTFWNAPEAGIDPDIGVWYGNRASIPGKGAYHAPRFMAVGRPGDKIRISPELRGVMAQLILHYQDVGIETIAQDGVIFNRQFGAAFTGPNASRRAIGFLFDDRMHKYDPNDVRLAVTRSLESKARFSQTWAEGGGLPPTAIIMNRSSLCTSPTPQHVWETIAGCSGRLKAAFCASGNDNVQFHSLASLAKLMGSKPWSKIDYVVQQDVGDTDVSVNYYAYNGKVYFLFGTRQLMAEGVHHIGNIKDGTYDDVCRGLTDQMAAKAAEDGFQGFFGFDCRVDSETKKAWVIECNARITAPVYAWLLAMRHRSPFFRVDDVRTVMGASINEVLPAGLRFSPPSGCGVIMHNPGILRVGACGVTTLAESPGVARAIIEEFRQVAAGYAQQAVAA